MDLNPAIEVLKIHKDELKAHGALEPDEYISKLATSGVIASEDRRQAAQIAVSMSNTFITLAVTSAGIFVTYVGAYERIHLISWRFLAIGFAFFALSIAYVYACDLL